MRFSSSIALLALAIAPIDVLAGHIRRALGETAPDSYIVYISLSSYKLRLTACSVLKKGSNQAAHISSISNAFSVLDTLNTALVKHKYGRGSWPGPNRSILQPFLAINGYSAKITGSALQRVASNPDVDYIVPDHIATVRIEETTPSKRAMVNALGRAEAQATNGTNGQGVDIYGIGTD